MGLTALFIAWNGMRRSGTAGSISTSLYIFGMALLQERICSLREQILSCKSGIPGSGNIL